MVKFATNASGAIWLTNASGILFSSRNNSSFRCYTLGPLCLWQCFLRKGSVRCSYNWVCNNFPIFLFPTFCISPIFLFSRCAFSYNSASFYCDHKKPSPRRGNMPSRPIYEETSPAPYWNKCQSNIPGYHGCLHMINFTMN